MILPIKNKPWKIIDIINWGSRYFTKNSIENSRKEIEWFLCAILCRDHGDLYLADNKLITDAQLIKFISINLFTITNKHAFISSLIT